MLTSLSNLAHNIKGLSFRNFAFPLWNVGAEISTWAVLLDEVDVFFSFNHIKKFDNIRMVEAFVNTDFLPEQIQQKSFDLAQIQYFYCIVWLLRFNLFARLVLLSGIVFTLFSRLSNGFLIFSWFVLFSYGFL